MPRTDVIAAVLTFSKFKSTNLMNFNSLRLKTSVCLLSLASGFVGAQTPNSSRASEAMTDSVVTVDALLKIENRLALAKAKRDAEGAGLLGAPEVKVVSSQPVVIPPASFTVSSIFGADGVLRANVSYNGAAYEGVRVGAPVGKCSVTSIKATTVQLAPGRGVSASQCPAGIWTGMGTQPAMAFAAPSGAVGGMPLPNGPLPSNLVGSPLPAQLLASQPAQEPIRKFEPAVDMRLPQVTAPVTPATAPAF